MLRLEVLPDSTRGHDLLPERERYEAAGVGSHWVVDPVPRDLVVATVLQIPDERSAQRDDLITTRRG